MSRYESEIREVTKDLPAESRPGACYWHDDYGFSSCKTDPDPECGIKPEHAEMLHEASMTRYLIGLGYGSFDYNSDGENVTIAVGGIEVSVPLDHSNRTQCILRLLAAACAIAEKETA